uniref:Uncharacterized protein n=1 Tax=Angiostrongylus cantonensis TaxID=6313 RepID=A0A0K0DK03_ANGCA
MLNRRNRSGSSTSVVSVISEEYFVAPPLCRRHSLSTNSLPSRPPSEALRHTLHGAPAFALALASGSGYSPASAPGSASASSPVSAPTSAPSFAAEPTPVPTPALAHVSSSDSDN